jgi:Raf kinase inhibitor-like YbhB/YbcL family protein
LNEEELDNEMQLVSPVFNHGETMPEQYTCKGQNINPPLNIVGVPNSAKSLALIMHDPDAVSGDFVHWLVWDIPPGAQIIGTNSLPIGAVQGQTGFGSSNYGGPCPPNGTGTHRYIFELYALDTNLNLNPQSGREKLQEVMKGHILSKSILTGLVAAAN